MGETHASPCPRGIDRRIAQNAWPNDSERRKPIDRRRHGYLSRSPLFEDLPYHLIEAAIDACPVRELQPEEILLQAGQANNCMYLVLSGRLEVRLGEQGSGDTIPIEMGETLGELSIIDGYPVSACVAAVERSRVVTIAENVFWGEFFNIPGFARNLARMLSSRMRQSNARIIERLREHLALEHLQKELQIARSIQTSMLPGRGRLFAGYQELEVCGLMDPARDIGGDLYDAFFIAPRRLALTIGDVSGKGIPAALFMARVIAQLRQVAMSETSPAALMARLNASLCEQNEAGMFVTLIYLVYDLDSGEYLYSNAGHNPPAVIGNGRCTYLDPPKGLVAGMMGEARYLQKAGTLAPGHTLSCRRGCKIFAPWAALPSVVLA